MSNRFFSKILFAAFIFGVLGCGEQQQTERDSPTSGSAKVYADQSFAPIVEAQTGTFQSLYKKSSLETEFLAESEIIKKFLNRESEIIITGRALTVEEKQFYKEAQQTLSELIFAHDAVTLVTHKNFPANHLSIEQLRDIFSGKVKNWNQIFPEQNSSPINIVFDKSGSANFRLLKDSLHLETQNINAYAAGGNQEVLSYIKENSGTLGIIGANWISDFDDPEVKERLKMVKVLDIAVRDSSGTYERFNPFQSDLLNGRYPLLRNIYIINSTGRTGLPTGLASFIMSDRGQRIVLKSGLMPAVVPGREINIR